MLSRSLILAQTPGVPLPTPVVNGGLHPAMVTVVVGLVCLLVLVVLVLTVLKLWKENFGRTPPIDVTLGAKAEKGDVDTLKVDIKGLAMSKDLDAIREENRLRCVGLEAQISDSRHQWREEFNAWLLGAKDRDEERAKRLQHLEQQAVAAGQSLAKLDERSVGISSQLTNLNSKLDRLVESRMAAKAAKA